MECTLAQIYKEKDQDTGEYRGGPAYYIEKAFQHTRARKFMLVYAIIFAVCMVLSGGYFLLGIQANGVADAMRNAWGINVWLSAAVSAVLVGVIIMGGVKRIANFASLVVPFMAIIYILAAVIIMFVNFHHIDDVFSLIFRSAFDREAMFSGMLGSAIMWGVKRGIYSNEAGQGTAPNAAATATVSHPVQQGLIQSLGVFVDTIIVCTATAFVILIAGPDAWMAEGADPSTLTTLAISHQLGGWTVLPMAILIFVLAYSSIIAAYVYTDVNMDYLTGGRRWASWTVRVVSVASATAGAVLSLDVVWNAVDIAMAIMTLTNLVALLWLFRWGVGALRDYEAQRADGLAEPVFRGRGNPYLPADVPGDVWA